MKKIFASVLAFVLFLGCCPVISLQAFGYVQDYYTYTISGGRATITDCDTRIKGDVVLPSFLGGYPVTAIGSWAFSACRSMTSVVIPAGVTTIGSEAFYGCTNMRSIIIPEGVVSIGGQAFSDCTSLTEVVLPEGLESIGYGAFVACTALTSVAIPNSLETIGANAFWLCRSLTSVTIPAGLTEVGHGAFLWCSSLTGIWVDADNLYYSSDDRGVLLDKEKTKLIFAPGAISGDYFVPDGVLEIAEAAFIGCCALTGIWVAENHPNYSNDDRGVLLNKEKTKILITPGGLSGNYAVPTGVTEIGAEAFSQCPGLEEVTIPEGVLSIGSYAFGDSGLTSVTIPVSVTMIGDDAFSGCRRLSDVYYGGTGTQWREIEMGAYCGLSAGVYVHFTQGEPDLSMYSYKVDNGEATITAVDEDISGDITIPSVLGGYPVTGIDKDAFLKGEFVTSVKIPESVTDLDEGTFDDCYMLSRIWVEEGNPRYSSDDRGVLFNKGKTVLYRAPRNLFDSYAIPVGVATIGNGAFQNCIRLYNVTIPQSVKTIGACAFWGCDRLLELRIPDGVRTLGDSAFYSCHSITSLSIPASVALIGKNVFAYCERLKEIRVDADNAFYSSDGRGVLFNKAKTTLMQAPACISGSYTIPSGVITIGENAFYRCFDLRSVIIPEGVQTIVRGAFAICQGLVDVMIPVSVTTIEDGVFDYCTALDCVYYRGSDTQWAQIEIGGNNRDLMSATRYYHYQLPGELTGDGSINEDDAIYLLQFVLMPGMFPVEQDADVDKNGTVNEDDAIYLLQHVLMPDMFPLK